MEISLNVDTAATFFPGKRTDVTVWAGSWVSHRSCLDGWVTCPVLMGESHVLSWWVSHMSGLDGWVTGPLLMGESQVFSWWASHRSSLVGWVTGPVLMGESQVLYWCYAKKTNSLLLLRLEPKHLNNLARILQSELAEQNVWSRILVN